MDGIHTLRSRPHGWVNADPRWTYLVAGADSWHRSQPRIPRLELVAELQNHPHKYMQNHACKNTCNDVVYHDAQPAFNAPV